MHVLTTAPAPQLDWLALPAGVLRHTFCLASTWQTPGSCLAAPVCRTWRSAAAGCRGTRLLYQSGRRTADVSLCTWLGRNSPHLEALILGSHYSSHIAELEAVTAVLQALADAAAAAQAAGAPLQLHTLRVLGPGPQPATVKRLLAGLPKLHTLQLALRPWVGQIAKGIVGNVGGVVRAALAPLKQATQLQQLYLRQPERMLAQEVSASVAELLPLSLQRLSWEGPMIGYVPDLSHLTQLTFLHLEKWEQTPPAAIGHPSGDLPPSLQQLEVIHSWAPAEVLEEQPQLVRAWHSQGGPDLQQQLSSLSNLQRVFPSMGSLLAPATRTALAQHANLSAVELVVGRLDQERFDPERIAAALGAVGSIRNLRSLELTLEGCGMAEAAALSALTGVTRLSASLNWPWAPDVVQHQALVEGISGMVGLRWLTTSWVVLQAGWAWLAGL